MKTFQTTANYTAYVHPKVGIIVQSTRKTGGVVMRQDHPQYASYLEAFETAIDAHEADDLCKSLLG